MQAEVLVAIISGAAGIAGAIIAWIQAIRANRFRADVDFSLERMKSETAVILETLKIENERRRKAFEEASQLSAPIETALDQAWHDIQMVKEVITKLLSPARYDKDIALTTLRPAVLSIEDNYGRYGSKIPENARRAWHIAKKGIGLVEKMVEEQDITGLPSSPLAKTLENLRRDLTDQQIALISAREGIRGALVSRTLELV